MSRYYDLAMPEMWSVTEHTKWLHRMTAKHKLCSVCNRIFPSCFPSPINVQYGTSIGSPNIHESSVTNIALIDRRLLEQLLPWINPLGWAVGRALDARGKEVPTHAVCYAHPVVEHRGGPPDAIRVCTGCGTIRPRYSEPRYLLSYDIADRSVVMDRIGVIYVREDVADRLDLSDLKPMHLKPIPVLDAPKDGLRFPTDPPWVRGVDARIPWDAKEGPPWEDMPRIGGESGGSPAGGSRSAEVRRSSGKSHESRSSLVELASPARAEPTPSGRAAVASTYRRLDVPDTWPVTEHKQWLREMMMENKLCTICNRVLHGWFPEAIDVRYARPILPFNIHAPSVTNIALIDRRLLERLLPWIDPPGWAIGLAIDAHGHEVTSHATCYAEPVVEERDGAVREVEVCLECGTIRVSSKVPSSASYLLSYDVAGRRVVMDKVGTIYVRQDVADQLDLTDLEPVRLAGIPVLDAPRDGLRFPSDPEWVRGVDARSPWDSKQDTPWDDLPRIGGDSGSA